MKMKYTTTVVLCNTCDWPSEVLRRTDLHFLINVHNVASAFLNLLKII